MKTSLKIIVAALFQLIGIAAYAQKLPNIQKTSVYAPANIKIDGKAGEWDNIFKAYNKATRLEYTIANDDKNLYLAIKCTDKGTIGKIIAGGLSFMVNISNTKKENGPALTFPLRDLKAPMNTFSFLDSAKVRIMLAQANTIKTLKIKGLPDSIISIYNEYGISAAITFNKGTLVYELKAPLKLLGLALTGADHFTYNIKLNGLPAPAASVQQNSSAGPPPPAPPLGLPANRSPNSDAGLVHEMSYATDFWGEYTLAKKP